MNKFKKTIFMLCSAAGAMLMGSCDDIKENDRYVELPAVEAQRVVLLEEFTGQICSNCPSAHETIRDLLAQHGGNLISVSIHGGPQAWSADVYGPELGLANSETEKYFEENGRPSLPQGKVNRTTGLTTMDKWAASILSELAKPSSLDMSLEATFNADSTAVEIETVLDPHDNINGYLQLWVVESGIVAYQLDDVRGNVWDYVHDHVLRAVVNGHDGEPVSLTTREPQTLSHTLTLESFWNPANIAIVGFVYNSAEGVLQAAETHPVAAD